MTVTIHDPCGDTGPSPKALTSPLDNLACTRIGVLDNGKPNAMMLMEEMARLLAARTGGTVTLLTAKRTAAEAAEEPECGVAAWLVSLRDTLRAISRNSLLTSRAVCMR